MSLSARIYARVGVYVLCIQRTRTPTPKHIHIYTRGRRTGGGGGMIVCWVCVTRGHPPRDAAAG